MNNSKSYVVQVGDKSLAIGTGELATQAGGAVVVQLGDSVVLCTATTSKKPREGIDFFPLTVDFEERKSYYQQLQRMLIDEDGSIIPAFQDVFGAVRAGVTGWVPNGGFWQDLRTIGFEA